MSKCSVPPFPRFEVPFFSFFGLEFDKVQDIELTSIRSVQTRKSSKVLRGVEGSVVYF